MKWKVNKEVLRMICIITSATQMQPLPSDEPPVVLGDWVRRLSILMG